MNRPVTSTSANFTLPKSASMRRASGFSPTTILRAASSSAGLAAETLFKTTTLANSICSTRRSTSVRLSPSPPFRRDQRENLPNRNSSEDWHSRPLSPSYPTVRCPRGSRHFHRGSRMSPQRAEARQCRWTRSAGNRNGLLSQLSDLVQQVVSQRATDAAIGHFDQLLLRAGEICPTIADQGRVNVDLAHIVDDDRNAQAFTIAEDVIEEGGFASSEEAGQNCDGQLLLRRNLICYNITCKALKKGGQCRPSVRVRSGQAVFQRAGYAAHQFEIEIRSGF